MAFWKRKASEEPKVDMMYDETSGRGGDTDQTQRMIGYRMIRSNQEYIRLCQSNGFFSNIVSQPAEDATREWIEITTNRDEDLGINRLIEKRLEELKFKEKLKDFIRYSRMFPKGSIMFYGTKITNSTQPEIELLNPLDVNHLQCVDFVNVIENPDKFYFRIDNQNEPTKKDYNKISFLIQGTEVHESRLAWLCNDFNPAELMGVSIIETVFDAVSAQDSALWSVSTMVQDLATKVFKSDIIKTLSKSKITTLLIKLKRDLVTNSAVALNSSEDFQKLIHGTLSGIKEIFEFIFDNMGGVSRMPKNILLGKSHGVVTAGEYDTINYYAQIAKKQENDYRPIIDYFIKLVVHEQEGEIYKSLGAEIESLDAKFKFKSLWKLDPAAQADTDLKNSQRDNQDVMTGKCSPEEARNLDPRMNELEDFAQSVVRNNTPPIPPIPPVPPVNQGGLFK